MDLQQTIDHLEQQAAKYSEAANTLRSLLPGQSGGATSSAAAPGNATAQPKRRGRQPGSTNKPKAAKEDRPKRFVSQATRDKISAATKARHEATRVAREKAAASSNNHGGNNAQ